MIRKFFSLSALSVALLGTLMLASTSNLSAQTAPAAPSAPSIGVTGYPYPTPSQYAQPTSIVFTVTLSDTTDGATIYYTVTNNSGSTVAQGSFSAPSFSTTANGTLTFSVPINQTGSIIYTVKAYAQIPVNPSTCPPSPASLDSATSSYTF